MGRSGSNIRERVRELVEQIGAWVDELLPAPAPQPVPVRVRPSRPGNRRRY